MYINKQLILENFKQKSNRVNAFNKLNLDPIIGEDDKSNWIVYDDESLNFLMNLENTVLEISNNVKVIDGSVFLQDKLPYLTLNTKEYPQIFVDLELPGFCVRRISCYIDSKVSVLIEALNTHLASLKKPLIDTDDYFLKACRLQFHFKKRLYLGFS